jgi:hypothetical protein
MYTTTTIIHYNRHLVLRQEFGKYKWRGKEFDTEEQAFKAIDDKITHFKNKNMEQNNFQWTDDLVSEYCLHHVLDKINQVEIPKTIEQFKASKAKPKEYEILERFKYGEVPCDGDLAPIKSVRRLSDNEVFSIGIDGVQSFYIECGKLWARCGNKGTLELSELQKAKQALFTTIDGKDIYKGDEYFIVLTKVGFGFEPYSYFGGKGSIEVANYQNDCKVFSTKEAAEEYILLNKPMLSIKDVEQCYTSPNPSPLYNEMYKNLIELAKSKTNQQCTYQKYHLGEQ